MIEARNLTKAYGRHFALQDVSFTLEEGKLYGLLGVNGAGKTTTLQLLSGYLEPSEGEVAVDGISMEKDPVACKRKISYLPEVPPLYPEFTVGEYLDLCAQLRGIPKKDIRKEKEAALAKGALRRVNNKLIGQLSKGFRQRVGFAAALIGDPEILLLDEPTNGLDPVQIVTLRNQLIELKKDKVVVVSSHVLSEIEQLADEYLIIAAGRLVARGKCDGSESLEELFLDVTQKAYAEIARKEAEEEALWEEENDD